MPNTSKTYLKNYQQWLASPEHIPVAGQTLIVNSPCLDHRGDYYQLAIVPQKDNSYHVHDESYTLDNLEMSGCPLTAEQKPMLEYLTQRLGITALRDNTLTAQAGDAQILAQKKHDLMQGMLTVNDIFYQEPAAEFFNSEVAKWMVAADIRFISQYKIQGKSGLNNFFDFIIPRSTAAGERFLFLANCLNETAINNTIYLWEDLRSQRAPGTECYLLVNDTNTFYTERYRKYLEGLDYSALTTHDIKLISWSAREEFRAALAA